MSIPSFPSLTPASMNALRKIARHVALIVVAAACSCMARNADAADEQPAKPQSRVPMVELQAEFVRATEAQVREVLGEQGPVSEWAYALDPERSKKLQIGLRSGKAEFFYNTQTIAKNGKRAVMEAVRELRYPSEFEPSTNEPGKVVPISFETCKVGPTIEFEPNIGPDGNTIDLGLVPSLVVFQGFISKVSDNKTEAKSDPMDSEELDKLLKAPLREGTPWQPIFSTRKVTTSVTIFSGQTIAIGFINVPKDQRGKPDSGDRSKEGEILTYVFVTARVVTAD